MVLDARPVADLVYEWLKKRIMVGVLAPGQRISIDALALETGVSRTPVREALKRLAFENLVIMSPRRGSMIRKMSRREIEQLYEARIFLEPTICEAVAATASDALIRDLEDLHELQENMNADLVFRDIDETYRYLERNAGFHLRIVEETENPLLIQMVGQLHLQPRMAPLVFGRSFEGPSNRIVEERKIVAAFKQRDGAGARDAMREHISNALHDLLKFMHEERAVERNGMAVKPMTELIGTT